MKGIIQLKTGTYLFRNDHGYNKGFWAWSIYDIDKTTCHKWNKLPKHGIIQLFDIDNPPPTVLYLPCLV